MRVKFRHLLWRFAEYLAFLLRIRSLRALLSREYIDYLSMRTEPRPHPFSLWSAEPATNVAASGGDYTAWPALTDRSFTTRHLASAEDGRVAHPPLREITELFARRQSMIESERSSLLFTFFAQWFTDSIFRTHPADPRRNTSNHDIDLCQVYGLDLATTSALRGKHGMLRSSHDDNGNEYPERLFEQRSGGELEVRSQYSNLPFLSGIDDSLRDFDPVERTSRKAALYASGLDRGNSSIGYVAINTIFLREHNRLCRELSKRCSFNDERLFQTARAINVVILLKLLVEDYINHILGMQLFLLEPGFAERRSWYRPNWIALEFNLLYRWHGLVPDKIALGTRALTPRDYRYNNVLVEQLGIGTIVDAMSRMPAGRIGLRNTPQFLLPVEEKSIDLGRRFRLQGYNDYRKRFGMAPLRDFDELTDDHSLAEILAKHYGSIDRLEYLVGAFAETPRKGGLFGDLMTCMVAYDALTQIFSNPLLSSSVYGEQTFTRVGMEAIESTPSIHALVERNLLPAQRPAIASLNRIL